MRPRRSPQSSWLGRLLRRWRPDRNPLRRRLDRLETAVLGLLVAVFLAGTPIAWHAAGSWAYAAYTREARTERTTLHEVRATLLQAAPGWSASGTGAAPDVKARWTAPNGQLRTGPVFVPNGLSAGNTVLVWTDQAGQLMDPPLQPTQVISRAQLARVLAVAVLAIGLFIAGTLAHIVLDRRRLAAWDADWLAKGPNWSHRG